MGAERGALTYLSILPCRWLLTVKDLLRRRRRVQTLRQRRRRRRRRRTKELI